MSSLINIYSLPKKKTLKETQRLTTYKKVLQSCHHKIKRVANASSGECYLFYTVPPFIIGLPRYDLASCKDYIIQKLKSNGFRVINLDKTFLFISWQHIQFDRLKEQQMEDMIHRINNGIPLITENTNNNNQNRQTDKFRPIHDTPSTEKFLLI